MIGYNIPIIMIRCLFITVLIESFIGLWNKKDFINIILVNCITNPIVVTVPLFFNVEYGIVERRISLYILEMITLFVEGYIYKKTLKFKEVNPFIISITTNKKMEMYFCVIVIEIIEPKKNYIIKKIKLMLLL